LVTAGENEWQGEEVEKKRNYTLGYLTWGARCVVKPNEPKKMKT